MNANVIDSPTEINHLFVPELGGLPDPEALAGVVSDGADLITNVYRDMGIFSLAYAEQAPELLRPGLEDLRRTHLGLALEPFVVVNLMPGYDLSHLMRGLLKNKIEPRVLSFLWNQYSLKDINRRTVSGQDIVEPDHGEIRGFVSEPTTTRIGESVAQHRRFIDGRVVLNITDYMLIQMMRREQGLELLDRRTFTRFPQMPLRDVARQEEAVGRAHMMNGDNILTIDESVDEPDYSGPDSVLRFSAGRSKM